MRCNYVAVQIDDHDKFERALSLRLKARGVLDYNGTIFVYVFRFDAVLE